MAKNLAKTGAANLFFFLVPMFGFLILGRKGNKGYVWHETHEEGGLREMAGTHKKKSSEAVSASVSLSWQCIRSAEERKEKGEKIHEKGGP